VVEGDLPVRTVLEASEAFCCGTGATVTPVGSVHYKPGHDELETETVTTFVVVTYF
jgi:branched-subunit amino acid aminotransferase/4-amino-4-deoxychorismate lyase